MKTLYISYRTGRLANRLVLFANFAAFAWENGHRIVNFAFHSYARDFTATAGDIYCQFPPATRRSLADLIPGVAPLLRGTRLPYRLIHAAGRLNEKFPNRFAVTLREIPGLPITPLESGEVARRIAPARTIFVQGWNFRAPGCVRRHAPRLRAFFAPAPAHAESSRRAVAALRSRAEVVVGVHIRRSDYRTWKGGRNFFSIERYAAWMRQLAAQFPGVRTAFLICSDEPRQAAEFPGLTVGFGPGVPVGDLYALAACDYVFGPISTFSQWASFQGNIPLWQPREEGAEARLDSFAVSPLEEVP